MTIYRKLEPTLIDTNVASKPHLQPPDQTSGAASTKSETACANSPRTGSKPNFAGRQISRIIDFARWALTTTYKQCANCAMKIFRQFFPDHQGANTAQPNSDLPATASVPLQEQPNQPLIQRQVVHLRSTNPIGESIARLLHPGVDADKEDFFKFAIANYPNRALQGDRASSSNAPLASALHSSCASAALGAQFDVQYREELSRSEWHLRRALAELAPECTSRLQINVGDGYLVSRFVANLIDRSEVGLANSDRLKLMLMGRLLVAEGRRVWQVVKLDKPDQVLRLNRIARQYARQFPNIYLPFVANVAIRALSFFPSRLWPKDGELVDDNLVAEFLKKLQFSNAQYLVFAKALLLYSLSMPFCHKSPTLGDIPALVARQCHTYHGRKALEQLGQSLTSEGFLGDLQAGKSVADALVDIPEKERLIYSATCAVMFATLHSALQCWWTDKICKLMFPYLLTYLVEMTPYSRCLVAGALLPLQLIPLAPALRLYETYGTWSLLELFEGEKFFDALEEADWLSVEECEPLPTSKPTNASMLRQLLS